jgi:hypothetical protein
MKYLLGLLIIIMSVSCIRAEKEESLEETVVEEASTPINCTVHPIGDKHLICIHRDRNLQEVCFPIEEIVLISTYQDRTTMIKHKLHNTHTGRWNTKETLEQILTCLDKTKKELPSDYQISKKET